MIARLRFWLGSPYGAFAYFGVAYLLAAVLFAVLWWFN
jgi:hypothetical protein